MWSIRQVRRYNVGAPQWREIAREGVPRARILSSPRAVAKNARAAGTSVLFTVSPISALADKTRAR
jgi:hypothetical protein